jgi:hypothetical protein
MPFLCPSIFALQKKIGLSKNEVICRAVREYRDNEKRDLERYKVIFEDFERKDSL